MRPHSTQQVLSYVLQQLKNVKSRPLIVGLSGPQGSGKSTVVKAVADELRSGSKLNVVEFSLDDVYLTHAEQINLAKSGNSLLQHRGLPGTHDIKLCVDTLNTLARQEPCKIPQYDKSAFAGQGDRASDTIASRPQYDVVLLEGWCVGFEALSDANVEKKWKASTGPLKQHSLEHAMEVNRRLTEYHQLWEAFDCLVHLDAKEIEYVYKWRLQQEHMMITTKGSGMTDNQVRQFVDGYMPAYELYNDQLRRSFVKKLWLRLDEDRRPVVLRSNL